MEDSTELDRRQLEAEIASGPSTREALEKQYGQVWDVNELSRDFTVKGFGSPIVVVERKADGVVGSLTFTATYPRYYFDFVEDK